MCSQSRERQGANTVELGTGDPEVEDLIDCFLIKVNLAQSIETESGYPTTTLQANIEVDDVRGRIAKIMTNHSKVFEGIGKHKY